MAERTADYPDDSRFRWTCEVTGITMDWWKNASNTDRDRFLAAVKRGQFEVAGMGWHMTPLMDHSMVIDVLKSVQFFRDLGIPVRSAMNTDVNGLPWGVIDALLDHGITGISMAINEHYGHALKPWPRAFNWEAPGGRTITAYNGFIYGVTSDRSLRIPLDMDEARTRVPQWAQRWEATGYPHPFLMMQITNIRYHDNGAPQAALPDFIRRFNDGNAANQGVKLRFGTLSEFFDRLRAEPAETLPTLRGDWTDWWNFGAGSTAHETAQVLRGQRDLDDALALETWHRDATPRRAMLHNSARAGLALYAEHTWGADRSISHPHSPETRTQQLLKLATVAEGASVARMLRRDGLERLAIEAGGDEPRVLVFNPHPFAVRQSVRLPYLPPLAGAPDPKQGFGLEDIVPTGPSSHRIQRQDVVSSDLTDERAFWSAPISVPPLSYQTFAAEAVRPADTSTMSCTDSTLSNGQVTLTFDQQAGGVTSLERNGVEYAAPAAGNLIFGVPVLEQIESGVRTDMFDKVALESPDWHKAWHTDWKARRHMPTKLVDTKTVSARGSAQLTQIFALSNGEQVEMIYRLLPDDPSVQIEAVVSKLPRADAESLYLPMMAALGPDWSTDYETGGATVALDDEQLPYASRHYITTQRFIRVADAKHELMVACPDAPLWQIGGFTYGRFGEPDGRVERQHPALLAWLTNNYWSTNFQADQSGKLRFRFTLLPAPKQALGASIQGALAHTRPLATHVYAERGAVKQAAASLLTTDLGPLVLTRLETDGAGVAMSLLNPGDETIEAKIGSGLLKLASAARTSLAGETLETLSCSEGTARFTVGPRAWTRIRLATH
ncbi:hypothetical protein PSQ19_15385 [Devosia algicola]|uniref:Glycoside hydrolase family 38 N-terminal domain-containing protein n=1 Tax=Devosia algicola TaxID=3026418 RepID=A0ABY7YU09_9HYPH|nr:hypothetical protein [Devosia algicola]WDR04335.1 hypothetical protein PSQ19_15385 [Devosia algicola]